jgi:hypothetical protein
MLIAKLFARRYREENDGNTDVEGQETVGSGNDARLAMLARINDQNDERSANEGDLFDVTDEGKTVPFVVRKADGKQEELKDEAIHEEIIDHDAEKAATKTEPELFTLKINGVERQVTKDELIARAQKVEAADQYLAEAARLRQEAEGKQQQYQQEEVAARSVEDDLALARAIQMGSEEEAVAAIRKIKATELSTDALNRTVDERLTFNEAISKFRTDFSDIVGDPHLNKMAQDMDDDLLRRGDKRSYAERYTAVGNEVRNWVKKFQPAVTEVAKPVVPVVDKQTRKENVQAVPKAAGGKTPSTVEEEKEETYSSVIEGIAKARGGPQWMSGMSR